VLLIDEYGKHDEYGRNGRPGRSGRLVASAADTAEARRSIGRMVPALPAGV
jgi:hypothetical protein